MSCAQISKKSQSNGWRVPIWLRHLGALHHQVRNPLCAYNIFRVLKMQCTFTGLCGDTTLLDIGGISNLFPSPKRSKIFRFKKILKELDRIQNRNFIIGGGLCTSHFDKYLAEVYIIYISKIIIYQFLCFL